MEGGKYKKKEQKGNDVKREKKGWRVGGKDEG